MSRIGRAACIVFLLICQNAHARCVPLPGNAALSDVVASAHPNIDRVDLTLSGIAVIPDAPLARDIAPSSLCRAAVGSTALNKKAICASRENDVFAESDRVTSDGHAVHFSLSYAIDSESSRSVAATLDRTECPPVLYRVTLGKDSTIDNVSPRPDNMTARDVTFNTTTTDTLLHWSVAYHQTTAADAEKIPPRSFVAKDSITGDILRRTGRGAAAIFLVLAALHFALPRTHNLTPQLVNTLKRPASAALCLVAGGLLFTIAREISSTATNYLWMAYGQPVLRILLSESRDVLRHLPEPLALTRFALTAIVLAILAAAFAVAQRFKKAAPLFTVLKRAALVALCGALVALVELATEQYIPLGYEVPALVISTLICAVAISSLQKGLDLPKRIVPVLIVLAALTVFFPVGPVVHGFDFEPSAAENTQVWFQFLAPWAADVLFSIALLMTGLHLVQDSSEESRIKTARALLVLLFLSLFNIREIGPTEAIALAGLWVLADGALFRAATITAEDAQVAPAGRPVLNHIAFDANALRTTAFVGGALAVVVFWLQYSMRPIADLTFAALFTANVLLTAFTKSALAALLLGCAFNVLRGGSAVAKAGLIAIVATAASLAANCQTLMTSRHALPTIIGNIDLLVAILLVAVFAYDIPNAKRQAGNLPLKDLFKGTTLGHAAPIIVGVFTAFVAAVSPVLLGAIGKALSDLLLQLVPHFDTLVK